jgi:5-oxoprolinase (ATP-hydrolysing) subunit C
MTLKVLSPGLHTLLVDFGRPGSRSLGVPLGGAADQFALAIGNGLVGNAPTTVALEINLSGPTLEADCPTACVVWGAPFELSRNERPLQPGYTFNLESGDTVRIGGASRGARAYFCVRGGFETPTILASRSATVPLQAGESLQCGPSRMKGRTVRAAWSWNREPAVLRVLGGSQTAWFSSHEFFEQSFAVASASNRMGLRLLGRPLTQTPTEIVSEPVCPGTVQVTRDGQCIVLGVDGQTIGGYPKIAQVISADVDKLGQLRANDKIRFEQVDLEEAENLFRKKQVELEEWRARLLETMV